MRWFWLSVCLTLFGCGGGGGSDTDNNTSILPATHIPTGQEFNETDSAQTIYLACQFDATPLLEVTLNYNVIDINSQRIDRNSLSTKIAPGAPCLLPVEVKGDLNVNTGNRMQVTLTGATNATVTRAALAFLLLDDDARMLNAVTHDSMRLSYLNDNGYFSAGQSCVLDEASGKVWLNLSSINSIPARIEHQWTFHQDSAECGGITPNCRVEELIAKLNAQNHCGRSNWRLPQIDELTNMMAFDRSLAIPYRISYVEMEDSQYIASANVYGGDLGGQTHRWMIAKDGAQVRTDEHRNDGFSILPVAAPAVAASSCNNKDEDFTVVAAGAVLDQRSNLMWQRCHLGYQFSGNANDELNDDQCTGTIGVYNLMEAETLAQANEFGGYTDWRLPTIKEAASLFRMSCFNPATNRAVFPGFGGLPQEQNLLGNAESIWSSTATVDGQHWRAHLGDGHHWANNTATKQSVLLVRDYINR